MAASVRAFREGIGHYQLAHERGANAMNGVANSAFVPGDALTTSASSLSSVSSSSSSFSSSSSSSVSLRACDVRGNAVAFVAARFEVDKAVRQAADAVDTLCGVVKQARDAGDDIDCDDDDDDDDDNIDAIADGDDGDEDGDDDDVTLACLRADLFLAFNHLLCMYESDLETKQTVAASLHSPLLTSNETVAALAGVWRDAAFLDKTKQRAALAKCKAVAERIAETGKQRP
jgi:hypothetical protein